MYRNNEIEDTLIDLQSETVQNMIAEQERNENFALQNDLNKMEETQHEDENLIPIPQGITGDLMNSDKEWRQSIISKINRVTHTGSCGKSVIFPHLIGFHSSRQKIH